MYDTIDFFGKNVQRNLRSNLRRPFRPVEILNFYFNPFSLFSPICCLPFSSIFVLLRVSENIPLFVSKLPWLSLGRKTTNKQIPRGQESHDYFVRVRYIVIHVNRILRLGSSHVRCRYGWSSGFTRVGQL